MWRILMTCVATKHGAHFSGSEHPRIRAVMGNNSELRGDHAHQMLSQAWQGQASSPSTGYITCHMHFGGGAPPPPPPPQENKAHPTPSKGLSSRPPQPLDATRSLASCLLHSFTSIHAKK